MGEGRTDMTGEVKLKVASSKKDLKYFLFLCQILTLLKIIPSFELDISVYHSKIKFY